ncbi:hypothetical protein ACN28E_03335 [Archangium lansingense]|uniref:hypothetical protein n=1 Tax=Archangium lansingense TaxID=2995310 RepID=UPI003B79A5BC
MPKSTKPQSSTIPPAPRSTESASIQKADAQADRDKDSKKNLRLADMSEQAPWKPKSTWRGLVGSLAEKTGSVVGGVGGALLGSTPGGMLGGVGAVGGGVVGAKAGGALAHKLFSEAPRARAASEMAQFRQKLAEADKHDKGVGAHFVEPSGSARKAELEQLKKRKLVTSNTVASVQTLPGTSRKVKTLDRSKPIVADPKEVNPPVVRLEDQLANPRHRADVAPNPSNPATLLPDIGRLGLVQRQKAVMETAKNAEPFLRKLESGGDLSATHVRKADALDNKNKPKAGFFWKGTGPGGSNQLHRTVGGVDQVVRAVGADEFTNLPNPPGAPANPNRVSSLLPVLSKPKSPRPSSDALKSTVGTWSEADLHPLAKKRDAHRLLHTRKDSVVASTGKKIDIPTFVTADHYTSAVPVTSVKDDYKSLPGDKLKPAYKTKPGRSSLQVHDETVLRQAQQAEQARKLQEGREKARQKAEREKMIRAAIQKRKTQGRG